MRKNIFGGVLFALIAVILVGCSQASTVSDNTQYDFLPDINTFSDEEIEQNPYMFPQVVSAEFVHDGIHETISPSDPRLIRLLNALSYSYDEGFTAWRQGHVTGDEFVTFISSGHPMLDIHFCPDSSTEYENEFSRTPRVIVSANRYLLLVDPLQSSWMSDDEVYANEHFPFVDILVNHYENLSDEEFGEILGDIDWGNNKWIDILAYAGFI